MEFENQAVYSSFTLQDLERVIQELFSNDSQAQRTMELLDSNPPLKKAVNKAILEECSTKKKTTRRSRVNIQINPVQPQRSKEMAKKLRLLVTEKCHNKCPMCCNKQFDINSLPVVDNWGYDEIMITGGEPLASIKKVRSLISLIQSIKTVQAAQGIKDCKFYVYTATRHSNLLKKIIPHVDGIVYTPHVYPELNVLLDFTNYIYRCIINKDMKNKSFRLCLFPEMSQAFVTVASNMERRRVQSVWNIKNIEWVKDCPVPEGEEFRRISILY